MTCARTHAAAGPRGGGGDTIGPATMAMLVSVVLITACPTTHAQGVVYAYSKPGELCSSARSGSGALLVGVSTEVSRAAAFTRV